MHDPFVQRCWVSNLMQLSSKECALNEFYVGHVWEEVEDNLVLLQFQELVLASSTRTTNRSHGCQVGACMPSSISKPL